VISDRCKSSVEGHIDQIRLAERQEPHAGDGIETADPIAYRIDGNRAEMRPDGQGRYKFLTPKPILTGHGISRWSHHLQVS